MLDALDISEVLYAFLNLNNGILLTDNPGASLTVEARARQRLNLSHCIERVFLVTLDKGMSVNSKYIHQLSYVHHKLKVYLIIS